MEGRLTDTAEGGMTDVVLVTTPAGLVTVRTKVALGTELRTPTGQVRSGQVTEIMIMARAGDNIRPSISRCSDFGLVKAGQLHYFKTFNRRPL